MGYQVLEKLAMKYLILHTINIFLRSIQSQWYGLGSFYMKVSMNNIVKLLKFVDPNFRGLLIKDIIIDS